MYKKRKKRQEIIHTAKGQGHQSLLSINPIVKITTESITEWIPSLCKGGAVHFCPPCLFNPAPFFFNTQKVFMSLIHRYSSPGSRGIQSFIHRLVVYPFSPVLFKPYTHTCQRKRSTVPFDRFHELFLSSQGLLKILYLTTS